MISFHPNFLRFSLPLVLAALGAVLYGLFVPAELASVSQQLLGFPDSDVKAHEARPVILAALCFLPALAAFIYSLGGTLDRYIARQFAGIFGVCITALIMIWLLMDLGNKIDDFLKSKEVIRTILVYYATSSPAILLLLLPYSLLLSLLYSLGKLSGSREIIAIIQAGHSVVRITLPLIIAGVFFTLLSLGLNYHWAPSAEGATKEFLAASDGKPAAEATNVLYRNAIDRRLWEIGAFPQNYQMGQPLLDVEVTTTHKDMTLESRLTAKRALWDRSNQSWTFEQPVIATYTPNQPPIFKKQDQALVVANWTETPWQLIKPGLSPDNLGIPDLNSWLQANSRHGQFANPAPYLTQWHYRWALPFSCMVTVLLATPLAIHFSRRGAGGGVFLAVVLSALMVLVSSISTALGDAGILRPVLAAWLPNTAFAFIGFYLFHRRISGLPIYLFIRRLLPGND
jgi:lipopolysaccharide export system permease protein